MNFAAAKEMSPYLEEPKAMPVGTPGKMGYLYLGFELDGDGRSIMRDLDRHAPLIVQQELYFDEGMPEMPCVSSCPREAPTWTAIAMNSVLSSAKAPTPIFRPVRRPSWPRCATTIRG